MISSGRALNRYYFLCSLLAVPGISNSLRPCESFLCIPQSREPIASIATKGSDIKKNHFGSFPFSGFRDSSTTLFIERSGSDDSLTETIFQSRPKPLATNGDWSAYLDESKGLLYYFHRRTGESKWEPPKGVVFPDIKMSSSTTVLMKERLKKYLEERLNASADYFMDTLEAENGTTTEPQSFDESVTLASSPAGKNGHSGAHIDKNRELINCYNSETKTSSRDRPNGFPKLTMSHSKKIALDRQDKRDKLAEGGNEYQFGDFVRRSEIEKSNSKTPDVGPAKTAPDSFVEENNIKDENHYPTPIVQQGEWTAHVDENSGLTYYFHASTGISTWDPPTDDFPAVVMEKVIPTAFGLGIKSNTLSCLSSAEVEERGIIVDKSVTKSIAKSASKADFLNVGIDFSKPVLQDLENAEPKSLFQENFSKATTGEKGRNSVIDNVNKNNSASSKNDPSLLVMSPLSTKTFYDILNCSPSASRAELKRSYIALARETHPDALIQSGHITNNDAEQDFTEISQAWKILSDSTSRRRYDRDLKAKGISKTAGSIFENWVMEAAKVMDEALTKAEKGLERGHKEEH